MGTIEVSNPVWRILAPLLLIAVGAALIVFRRWVSGWNVYLAQQLGRRTVTARDVRLGRGGSVAFGVFFVFAGLVIFVLELLD